MVAPALRRVTRAADKAALALKDRDEAIRQAHADGSTIRAIAVAASLSSARVHQILHGK